MSAAAAHPFEGTDFTRKALHASLNGLYVHDLAAGVNVFINEQYARLTGYDLAALQAMGGAGLLSCFHPDDQPRVLAHMEGMRGAAEYEVLVERAGYWPKYGDAVKGMDSQSATHILILLLIVIGNAGYFLGRKKKRGGAQ